MSKIDKILHKYNWPIKESISNFNVEEIENRIGFELPHDYKEFVLKYSSHETQVGEEYCKLWDSEKLLELNQAYQIIDNLKMTVGIGDNGGGEFIALEFIGGKTRVILSPFIDLDKQYHIEIGSSFTNFLERMDKEQKWFDED
jgi:hypothetical protein